MPAPNGTNSIELAVQCTSLLDELYASQSLTAILDGSNDLARDGANAGEILIPMVEVDGLANYDRASGYKKGGVKIDWETKTCNYDRGLQLSVDAMDDQEARVGFGLVMGELERVHAIPELDCFRLATYATNAGKKEYGSITTGAAAIAALRAADAHIFNKSAKKETCVLFIAKTVHDLVEDLDTTKSKKALEGWAGIVVAPDGYLKSTCTLSEEGFGYTMSGDPVNFVAVPKEAVIQFQKHKVNKIFTPDQNQDADAYKGNYRNYGICEVKDNKQSAIYAHINGTAPSEEPTG